MRTSSAWSGPDEALASSVAGDPSVVRIRARRCCTSQLAIEAREPSKAPRRLMTCGQPLIVVAPFRTTQIRCGPPMSAVIAPAGISAGASKHPTERVAGCEQRRRRSETRTASRCDRRRRPAIAAGAARPVQRNRSVRSARPSLAASSRARQVAADQRPRHVRAARRGPRFADGQQVPASRLPNDQDAHRRARSTT